MAVNLKHRLKPAMALVFLLALPASSLGHEGATGIVKQRMDLMKVMQSSTKSLASIYRGSRALETKVVANNARLIAANALRIAELFPRDSIEWPSEARPEIWQDWAAFDTLAKDLARKSLRLAVAIESEPKSDSVQMYTELTAVCGQCHKKFREVR